MSFKIISPHLRSFVRGGQGKEAEKQEQALSVQEWLSFEVLCWVPTRKGLRIRLEK